MGKIWAGGWRGLAGAAAIGWAVLPGPAAASERAIALGADERLPFAEAGLTTVPPLDTAFGFAVEGRIATAAGDREASAADYARACEAALDQRLATDGRGAPDYVFFRVATGTLDLGITRIAETRDVFFAVQSGRCRALPGRPVDQQSLQ